MDEWPYNSVLEAMNDGWRVIKFPEMALMLQEDKTFGLGCEFILEKINLKPRSFVGKRRSAFRKEGVFLMNPTTLSPVERIGNPA